MCLLFGTPRTYFRRITPITKKKPNPSLLSKEEQRKKKKKNKSLDTEQIYGGARCQE
jgi:hypothetical protein